MFVLNLVILICVCFTGTCEARCGQQVARNDGEKECGLSTKNVSNRIAGGFQVLKGQFPSYVQIERKYTRLFIPDTTWCGGTLIDDEFIVTAAHCFPDSFLNRNEIITVKSYDGTVIGEIDKYAIATDYVHQVFAFPPLYNDIAVAKLKDKIQFNDEIQPACMPDEPFHENQDEMLYNVGKGKTSPWDNSFKVLYGLKVLKSTCVYPTSEPSVKCARDVKGFGLACSGDSGGPLYAIRDGKQVLIGVTSFAPLHCQAGQKPIEVGYADVYNLNNAIEDLKAKLL